VSPFFVKHFKKKHKCPQCSRTKLFGYSLCLEHLKKAREYFMKWANERRAIGRCILCNRKSRIATRGEFKGQRPEIRCALHARLNREKCLKWHEKNPNYHKEQWRLRKALRDAGMCPSCPEHRPLPQGQKRCTLCRIKHREGYAAMRAAEAQMVAA
jgi:hypothetical protein